ncbi:rhodanese-like domain-containing protein [Pseudaquidulcibacter saccharophilus]|uniref:rhodanese-like domain-containing protein n=1 Tax=Pseudaquidulcibacter saccharophilus TaxID=2831900 RepID=UPI001EFEF6C8|nr:rhodanese-like domain-containing protein [Pseudaquidulcibacter saccharophilus]
MQIKNLFIAAALIGAPLLSSCAPQEMVQAQSIKTIDAASANTLIANNAKVTIIDVRTPEEFAGGHVPNAVNIDFKSPEFAQNLKRLPKEKPYIVYCRTGHRSGLSMDAFKQLGFKDVYNVAGGITAWQGAGMPK